MSLFSGADALGLPDNGVGPTIPGGPVIGPVLPPGVDPCQPPPMPPGLLLPSYARGRIQETCGGNLRAVADKPFDVILRVFQQPLSCDPNYIPPAYHFDVPMASGITDSDGRFDVEFYTTDAGVSPNDYLSNLKVRVVVYDDSGQIPIWETAYYGQNSGQEFYVYEDVNHCLTEGTRVRVVSPGGTGSFNAEVFVNGRLHPVRSNANGFVIFNPPLAAGSTIVARAMVHESKSERGSHSQGSNQNWKYRAYITSLPLEHDANGDNTAFRPTTIVDPNGAYELRLNRDAAYIGLHVVASIEWDASPSELTSFATKMDRASEYFFNATDGQMLIERVDVYDDGKKWDESDFRVYADASLRAHVDWPSGGFWTAHDASFWRSNWMHMSRSNDHPVYNHEFGHYGMKLKDEYSDDDDTHCAHGVGGSIAEFDSGGGKASCMMYSQWGYTKICSGHQDNPHLGGTKQGSEDCWSEIKRHFTAEAPGPNGAPRWRIRTPVDRAAIVGRLPKIPVADWAVHVAINDANNVDLCRPVQFQWVSNGGFAQGARVFSRTASGRTIIQGTTDATGVIEPFQDNVRTVAGLHIGDTIGAMWTFYGGGSFQQFSKTRKFTDADCMSAMVVLSVAPGQAPPAPQEQIVEAEVLPFALAVQLEPGATIGNAVVRVRADAELAAAPIVRMSISNEANARDAAMFLDNVTGDWLGSVTGLPPQFAAVIDVAAVDNSGAESRVVAHTTFTGAVDDEDSELATVDGSLELAIPAGALAAPTQIAIGDSVAPLPHDFAGRILAGPISMTTNGAELSMPATLKFMLPFESEDAMLAQLNPDLLIVLAFDEAADNWNEIDASFLHGELAVVTDISKFGAFVLLERGIVDHTNGSSDAAPGSFDNAENEGDDASGAVPSASADCGTGAFGAGMALVSPMMLLLGARRRIRSHRSPRI